MREVKAMLIIGLTNLKNLPILIEKIGGKTTLGELAGLRGGVK